MFHIVKNVKLKIDLKNRKHVQDEVVKFSHSYASIDPACHFPLPLHVPIFQGAISVGTLHSDHIRQIIIIIFKYVSVS